MFSFPGGDTCITATSGVNDQQGRPFTHGYEIHLEQATLHFEYAALESGDELMPLKVIREDGTVEMVKLEGGDPVDAFIAEIKTVVECVNNNQTSDILNGELARDAIRLCQAQAKSLSDGAVQSLGSAS